MVSLQTAVQEVRKRDVIPVNSPVGESQCNGRVEGAIRRVQEKIRVIKHQVESNTKCKLNSDLPIMVWLTRWAAELVSKYAPGEDGRTPYERIRNEECMVPTVFFGETILYLPIKTVRRNKGDAAKKQGVWIGTIERTEEAIIGIEHGVIKCRTVTRLAEGDRWSADNIKKMRGFPWEPIPGRICSQIPVDVEDHDDNTHADEMESIPFEEDEQYQKQDVTLRGGPDKLHISRKAVNKYGKTDGCPACEAIKRRGDAPGRLGYNHSQACRERIMAKMNMDPEYQELMQRHRRFATENSIFETNNGDEQPLVLPCSLSIHPSARSPNRTCVARRGHCLCKRHPTID